MILKRTWYVTHLSWKSPQLRQFHNSSALVRTLRQKEVPRSLDNHKAEWDNNLLMNFTTKPYGNVWVRKWRSVHQTNADVNGWKARTRRRYSDPHWYTRHLQYPIIHPLLPIHSLLHTMQREHTRNLHSRIWDTPAKYETCNRSALILGRFHSIPPRNLFKKYLKIYLGTTPKALWQ